MSVGSVMEHDEIAVAPRLVPPHAPGKVSCPTCAGSGEITKARLCEHPGCNLLRVGHCVLCANRCCAGHMVKVEERIVCRGCVWKGATVREVNEGGRG